MKVPRSFLVCGLVTALVLGSVPALAAGPTGRAPDLAAVGYEAEDGVLSRAVVEANHPGYTGTGFVNYDNVAGGSVEWTVSAARNTTTTLLFRYANGTAADRPLRITVNGTGTVTAFPATGAWTTWRTVPVTATLAAGPNAVRATATASAGGPNLDSVTVGGTDWSTAVVGSTMRRKTPDTLGGWGYTQGLYLYGQYLVYQRTRDPRLLAYLRQWADRFVAADGGTSFSFDNLDQMQSGNVLLLLARETGLAKYQTAARKIRDRLRTYPTTSDGGLVHATGRPGQLWADGSFMVAPFVIRYGHQFGEARWGDDLAARQLLVYAAHLQQGTGLLSHAYDENRSQSWADPRTGLSSQYWCRAIGWYGMAAVDILELLPADHPDRAAIVDSVRRLVAGYARYQDPATGRWFQVVDRGDLSGNWTETSCSSMYTFTVSRAVRRGYVDASYQPVADKGYRGVLAKVGTGPDGLTDVADISVGTNVGDLSYYLGRTRATNDLHGLGAFLIMNEESGPVG
ncbi:glycoside hydrolase family 88 protein [Longispora sp. NPDC051575]|uniref:glycoside hydrolase family 88 protein n=1 Tax=Longispora sp. NPDC051575 TaxID=3154943 RepID=UPI003432F6CA